MQRTTGQHVKPHKLYILVYILCIYEFRLIVYIFCSNIYELLNKYAFVINQYIIISLCKVLLVQSIMNFKTI